MDNSSIYDLIAQSLKRKKLIFFIGSGLSIDVPCSLPSGEILRKTMIQLLKDELDIRNAVGMKTAKELESLEAQMPFEVVWEKHIDVLGEKCLEALNVLKTDKCNLNHKILAFLATENLIDFIITLNFDAAIENASQTGPYSYDAQLVWEQDAFDVFNWTNCGKRGTAGDRVLICKLHGTLDKGDTYNTEIVATVKGIRAVPPRSKRNFLKSAIADYDLLCCGYGNRDVDTFPVINKSRNKVYWLCYRHTEVDEIDGLRQWADRNDGCLHILRKENDNLEFSEVMREILVRIYGEAYIHKIFKEIEASLKLANPRGVHDHVTDFIRILKSHFSDIAEERIIQKALIYSFLVTTYGRDETAIKIMQEYLSDSSIISKYPKSYCKFLLFVGNVKHGITEFSNAFRNYTAGKNLHGADPRDKLQCELELASSYFSKTKWMPIRVDLFQKYMSMFRYARLALSTGYSRFLWERGDMWQYIGDYLFDVQKFLIAVALTVKKRRIQRYFIKVVDVLTYVNRSILSFLRTIAYKKSFTYYDKLIRVYSDEAIQDMDPGYTILARLRRAEVLAALGQIDRAEEELDEMVVFSAWLHKGGHGYANALCTKGIVAYYRGDHQSAELLLTNALDEHGSHVAGLIKATTYLVLSRLQRGKFAAALHAVHTLDECT